MRKVAKRLGAIALLALLVRALVPAGYMLASAETAQGRYLVVQLCDSHAGFTQIIDLDTGLQVDPDTLPGSPNGKPTHDKTGKAPCLFATAPHFASPQLASEVVAIVTRTLPTGYAVAHVSPGRGIPAPPPPSTGPPQLI